MLTFPVIGGFRSEQLGKVAANSDFQKLPESGSEIKKTEIRKRNIRQKSTGQKKGFEKKKKKMSLSINQNSEDESSPRSNKSTISSRKIELPFSLNLLFHL